MKIETPQILWHNGADNENGKNAPIYSLSLLESGICNDALKYGHVLATAGNSSEVNLWKISFRSAEGERILSSQNHKIQHMLSLTRHERTVNAVAFSPDGLHLASAGDGGSILIWSVPPSKRGNHNGRHFWSSVEKENSLSLRVVSSPCEGICDLSWSPDSKRLVVGTIDHCVYIYEDVNYDTNLSQSNIQKESQWRSVYRNASDHTSYVQGVTYDPLGVYVASMGSDRTVRVYSRKAPSKSKKLIKRPTTASGPLPPPEHQETVQRLLQESKLEFSKSKLLKFRFSPEEDQSAPPIKHHLFADESTVKSFFRRLSWTTDGAFLVTPAALYGEEKENATPSFATFLFARHTYDKPYKVLPGLEQPSVVVRPSPVLYQLPEGATPETKLPYRSVFAVLTLTSVLIYDTYHEHPLCIARGLHYAGLTDCSWSADGCQLLVSSTDGYISILSFKEDEFGKVYEPPKAAIVVEEKKEQGETTNSPKQQTEPSPRLPPCEPGQAATLEARPAKRAKTRITPTLVSAPGDKTTEEKSVAAPSEKKRIAPTLVSAEKTQETTTEASKEEETDKPGDSATDEPKPKKKRIQPTLVSVNP